VSAVTASDLTQETLVALDARIAKMRAQRPDDAVALWRLQLSGGDAGMLLSLLAREHGLNVALVQARVEDVQGVPVGTLFTLVQAGALALQAALRDVTAHHATVEELRHEPATR